MPQIVNVTVYVNARYKRHELEYIMYTITA